MKNLANLVLAAVMGSALTLGASWLFQPEGKIYHVEHVPATPAVSARYDADGKLETPIDFSQTAEQVTPAVVHIKSTVSRRASSMPGQGDVPDLFRYFFDEEDLRGRGGTPRPQVGTGSGVIISADGVIVTNNHVIDKAEDIEVTLFDKRSYKAKVIGTDPTTDLAVIKIQERELPFLPFANSDDVKVGEWVLAVGNPFNLNSTVTAGIVSAKARNINILQDRTAIESFIQTDAAVNPGNSGGALVDIRGRLIGINTAIASRTGSYAGYSFAVPSRIVSKVVEDLLEYGTVQRGFLGVTIRSVNAALVREYDLAVNEGVLVDSLTVDGAAREAGIQPRDVIVAVDGKKVRDASSLQELIGTKRPGDMTSITVNRDGDLLRYDVTLKSLMGNTQLVAREQYDAFEGLGAEFVPLTEEELSHFGVKAGLKVARLYPGKILRDTKMEENFIITHVDNKPVQSVKELAKIVEGKKGGLLIEGFYPDAPEESFYYALGLN